MPCIALPPFPTPPALPPGFTFPLFPGLTLAFAINICCNIQIPPWGPLQLLPAISIPIALPAAVVAAYATAVATIKKYYDMIGIPCPNE